MICCMQKALGGSKTTTKRSVETEEKIPISTFFAPKEEKEEDAEITEEESTNKENQFPVFDAVQREDVADEENTSTESKFPVFDAVPK